MLKWPPRDVLNFIEVYKQLECLWNPDCPDYNNFGIRSAAYQSLVDYMKTDGLTIEDIKIKIQNIRSNYARILRSQKAAVSSNPPRVLPHLTMPFWFSLVDSFLRDVTERKRKKGVKRVKLENRLLQRNHERQSTAAGAPAASSSTIINYLLTDATSTPSGAFIANQAAPAPAPDPARTDNITTAPAADEFDHFAHSIATQLRSLPELDALDLMQDMQAMIIGKKRQLLREQALGQTLGTRKGTMSTTSDESWNSDEEDIIDPFSGDVVYSVKQELL